MANNEFIEGVGELEDTGFKITDLTTADWAMRKLKALDEKRAEKKAFYEQEAEKLKLWLEHEEKVLSEKEEYFKTLLRPWIEKETEGSRSKSVNLPHGRCGLRTTTTVAKDEELFGPWVKKNAPQYVKQVVTEKLDWASLKKACQTDESGRFITPEGEIVEGVVQHKETKIVVSF